MDRTTISQKLFISVKLQISLFSYSNPDQKIFPKSYLYAWDKGIYPIYHDSIEWHIPFPDEFQISKSEISHFYRKINEIFTDESFEDDSHPEVDFYAYFNHVDSKGGGNSFGWGNEKIRNCFRYLYFSDDYRVKKIYEKYSNESIAPSVYNFGDEY